MKVYWNGSVVEERDVCISPWDLGFLRGFGVFDYFGVYAKKPFMAEAHFARLETSANILSIPVPLSKDAFIETVRKLIHENNLNDGYVRVVLTGGISSNGMTRDGVPTFLIRPEVAKPIDMKPYEVGASLITVEYMRDTPGAKTTHYAEAQRNANRLTEENAIEMLFTHKGYILECSRSNIFIVRDGVLITPRDSILPGITRLVVLEEAKKHGLKTEERAVLETELTDADEVFITGTGKGVVPIVKINKTVVSNGLPGTITNVLMKRLGKRKREHA
ncbi:MAG: aminotransferase class IV [Candidatus Paceibacterota bacterium]